MSDIWIRCTNNPKATMETLDKLVLFENQFDAMIKVRAVYPGAFFNASRVEFKVILDGNVYEWPAKLSGSGKYQPI